jgi:phage shock protein C
MFGGWWQDAVRQAFRIAWPLALIALGALLYLSATRGGLRGGTPGKRLYRSRERMVGGVLAGVAEYLGTDPTLVRVLYVVFGVLTGVGPAIVVYIIAMIVVPEQPAEAVEEPVWPVTATPVEPPPAAGTGWPHSAESPTPAPPAPPAPEPPVPPDPEHPPDASSDDAAQG